MKTAPTQPPSLDQVQAVVQSVCAQLPVRRVELFGSLARGESHPGSDVDLLVDFLPGSKVGLFEMGALQETLAEGLHCRVDLVSRPAIEKSANPYRRRAILSAPVTVYAR